SVGLLSSRSVQRAQLSDGRVRLELADPRGQTTMVETDHVICATGYRADVDRLTFIDQEIRAGINTIGTSPALTRSFESSAAGLYFVGLPAAVTFGPLMRFMHGDRFAAQRLASHLTGRRSAPAAARSPGVRPLPAQEEAAARNDA